jgi:DNA-binding GntR family transcriptional regulator
MRNSNLERLSPGPTLIDRAYEAILSAICDGRLPPNHRVNQDDLAAMLSISRQPVGQALNILKSQGFVRDNGRRGLVIAPLERELIRSIYQLREALDSMAAGLAAERCTLADFGEGRKLLAEGRKACETESIGAIIAADQRFHMWIYNCAGNPILVETMNHYWNHLRRAMGEILRHRPSRRRVWQEHETILRAILERDGATAASLAMAHARDAASAMIDAIPANTGIEAEAAQALPAARRAPMLAAESGSRGKSSR